MPARSPATHARRETAMQRDVAAMSNDRVFVRLCDVTITAADAQEL